MNRRCYNPKLREWHRYGGRGISVCDRWRNSFAAFLEDMGDPGPGFQLDRVDNDAGYSKTNCRWATAKANSNNRRDNRLITANGETLTLAQWSDRTGLCRSSIQRRIAKGLTGDEIVAPPRQACGERQGKAKLTAEQVREIRRLREAEGLTTKELGEMFGINGGAISLIIRRINWKHVA